MPLQVRTGAPRGGNGKSETRETLNEEVVQVILPDGDVDVRLVTLDLEKGLLVLQQVSHNVDTKQVTVGSAATVKLASIGAATQQEKSVRLHAGARGGPVLLELRFADAETARTWCSAIDAEADAASNEAPRSSAHFHANGDDSMSILRTLVEQQEEQARLLEAIVERKGEQLMKLQEHLQDSLVKLQMGQTMYAQQQKVMDTQQKAIQALQSNCKDLGNTASVSSAKARAGAAAKTQPQSIATPVRGRPEHSSNLFGARTPPPSPDVQGESSPEGADAEGRLILARLRALEAEKAECEAQLRKEQGDIASQLHDLQAMMNALGLGGISGRS